MAILKRPPGPQALPIIGNPLETAAYIRNPTEYFQGISRRYGDIAYAKFGQYDVYYLNHPDYIKEVLVTHGRNFIKDPWTGWLRPMLGMGLLTSDGDFHLRQRRLMQPHFHRSRIATYADAMVESAEETRERWRDGQRLDASSEMMSLTLDIVAKALFKSDVEEDTKDVGEALDAFMAWFFLSSLPYSTFLQKLPLPVNRRFAEARKKLDKTIYRLIREHRASGDQGDLLSMLLGAQDTEGNGGGMTDMQVRDEAMTIFLAGHETTANALAWTWYLLSRNPRVERELHRELDEVLGGRPPSLDDLSKLRYTEMVFSETLRLYPPAWGIAREAINEFELGGYTIPAGSVLSMSQYVVHRDPRWWPNPDNFEPLRWAPEEKAKRPKFAYFPFGGGNRLCIGEQFAWMEGALILATLAQRWQMRLATRHKVGTQPRITLRPKGGMPMVVRRRVPKLTAQSEAPNEKVELAV